MLVELAHWILLGCFSLYQSLFYKKKLVPSLQTVTKSASFIVKKPTHLAYVSHFASYEQIWLLINECLQQEIKILSLYYLKGDGDMINKLIRNCKESVSFYVNETLANKAMLEHNVQLTVILMESSNGHELMATKLSKCKNKDPLVKAKDLTVPMLLDLMYPLTQIDLIVSTQTILDLSPMIALTIGFAEIYHYPSPIMTREIIQSALTVYAICKQNFGK